MRGEDLPQRHKYAEREDDIVIVNSRYIIKAGEQSSNAGCAIDRRYSGDQIVRLLVSIKLALQH